MKKHVRTTEKPSPKSIRIRIATAALALVMLATFALAGLGILNRWMIVRANPYISDADSIAIEKADCILVLGCGVWSNGTPSWLLRNRLDKGIELYKRGVADRIIMSGDHRWTDYDEVNVMKQYAINAGVPSEAIFMDHAGLSTYESMYRAREIFEVQTIVIVTQEYHLHRAVYDAMALGLTAAGVPSDEEHIPSQTSRSAREILARAKDVVWCIVQPAPTYLGDSIPVSGNGDVTNDKQFT